MIRYNDSNLIKERKFIVFFTQLLALVAGTSATKVLRVFEHMGLKCIALSTYFAHQRVGLVMIIQQ